MPGVSGSMWRRRNLGTKEEEHRGRGAGVGFGISLNRPNTDTENRQIDE